MLFEAHNQRSQLTRYRCPSKTGSQIPLFHNKWKRISTQERCFFWKSKMYIQHSFVLCQLPPKAFFLDGQNLLRYLTVSSSPPSQTLAVRSNSRAAKATGVQPGPDRAQESAFPTLPHPPQPALTPRVCGPPLGRHCLSTSGAGPAGQVFSEGLPEREHHPKAKARWHLMFKSQQSPQSVPQLLWFINTVYVLVPCHPHAGPPQDACISGDSSAPINPTDGAMSAHHALIPDTEMSPSGPRSERGNQLEFGIEAKKCLSPGSFEPRSWGPSPAVGWVTATVHRKTQRGERAMPRGRVSGPWLQRRTESLPLGSLRE